MSLLCLIMFVIILCILVPACSVEFLSGLHVTPVVPVCVRLALPCLALPYLILKTVNLSLSLSCLLVPPRCVHHDSCIKQGSYGHEKPGKVMEF